MAVQKPENLFKKSEKSVIKWLLDSDPSIRWQTMRDVLKESDEVVSYNDETSP